MSASMATAVCSGQDEDGASPQMSLCPQQVFVCRSIEVFLAEGGDLRFEVADVRLDGLDTSHPAVTYQDAAGVRHEIDCEIIAGCDGDHGISRACVPDSSLTVYEYDHGIAWLTVLADAPPPQTRCCWSAGTGSPGTSPAVRGSAGSTRRCWPRRSRWPAVRRGQPRNLAKSVTVE